MQQNPRPGENEGALTAPPAARIPLVMLGSGDYVFTCYEAIGLVAPNPYELKAFSQNLDPSRRNETYEGLPVHWVADLEPLAPTHHAICILGDGAAKRRFVEQVRPYGFRFASMRSAMSRVSPRSHIGEGDYMGWSVTVSSHCEIGSHVTLMVQTMIGESVKMGDYVYCAPGVRLGGACEIGEAAFIGMGAMIRDRVRIGAGAVVGIGAVVTRDVPDGATVVGNPAREMARRGSVFKTSA